MSLWQTCSENIPERGKTIRFMLRTNAVVHEGRFIRYGDAAYYQVYRDGAIYRPAEVLAWVYAEPEPEPERKTEGKAEHAGERSEENQEAKADAGKLDPTLVPSEFIWAAAAIRRYGTKKYGSPDNWKRVSVERYRSAAYRHWLLYLADPHGVDEESGYPHLWHWICNAAFIAELEKDYLKKYYETNKEE